MLRRTFLATVGLLCSSPVRWLTRPRWKNDEIEFKTNMGDTSLRDLVDWTSTVNKTKFFGQPPSTVQLSNIRWCGDQLWLTFRREPNRSFALQDNWGGNPVTVYCLYESIDFNKLLENLKCLPP